MMEVIGRERINNVDYFHVGNSTWSHVVGASTDFGKKPIDSEVVMGPEESLNEF